jgi:thermitase
MKKPLRSIAMTAIVGATLTLPAARISALPLVPPVPTWAAASQYVPGEVLVKFKSTVSAQERTAAVTVQGHSVLANVQQLGWVHAKIGVGQTVETALTAYQSDPNVEYVQPNYIYHTTAVPNDPQYSQLWAFKNTGQPIDNSLTQPPSSTIFATHNPGASGNDMNIELAWDNVITDCSSVVVAVLDSGVNYNQEDLAANMWDGGLAHPKHGDDFVDNDNDPMDLNGHGTHVAGIIGAVGNNAKGTTGVCQKASIMAVRVLDATGSGKTADIIQGISFAATNGAKVINMSLSGGGVFDQAFSDAIANAQSHDIAVVVAAGNAGSNNDIVPLYPCNFTQPNLVCVAALDQAYELASFSNFGATSVHVGAPGTNILSTWAGAATAIKDNFHTGSALNWTTNDSVWAYKVVTLMSGPADALVNPATFPSGTYANSADNRVYKPFTLGAFDAATLNFFAQVTIQPNDSLNVNYRSGGSDPFAGGVLLLGGSGTTGGIVPFSFDLSPCLSATCSVGFQLLSDASDTGQGAGILAFSIQTLQLNTTSYNTISGTSMATPEVAGLATMLRAYNPQFTYADTVNAIKNGGRSVVALAGKTTSGKAVDVMSSLAYINPPTGLTATVQ